MQAWEAIQKTLDYMEEHYEEELTIEQLSTIAHLSRFYYQRLFYRLTGYTVSEYLRSVRLKMAAGLLKADNGKNHGHCNAMRIFQSQYLNQSISAVLWNVSGGVSCIIGYPSGSCDQAGAAHAIYPGG